MCKFNFGNENDGQRKAITATKGPVLIIAGPGTGKTYTLVKRTIYLITECSVKPENILIATFTEKAAKELITRITNELASLEINININDMYIGTFHSICLRILKENLDYTNLSKNFRILDGFDQQYLVFQNIKKFRSIPNILDVVPESSAWFQSEKICFLVNNLTEELVDVNALINDNDLSIKAMGNVLTIYKKL